MNEPVIGKIRLHTSIRRIGRALQGIRWWVMSYPRQLEREEYDRFYQYLCSVVMKTL